MDLVKIFTGLPETGHGFKIGRRGPDHWRFIVVSLNGNPAFRINMLKIDMDTSGPL